MTIKVAVHRVCDRCQQPFDATSLKYGEDLPKFELKSIAACVHEGPKGGGTDKILFSYEDLCSDCERVVDGYIRRIRMEEPDEVKPRKSKKGEKPPEVAVEGDKPPAKEARFEPETPAVAQAPSPTTLPSPVTTPGPKAAEAEPPLF